MRPVPRDVFVTGGAGYIGSRAILRLVEGNGDPSTRERSRELGSSADTAPVRHADGAGLVTVTRVTCRRGRSRPQGGNTRDIMRADVDAWTERRQRDVPD